MSWKPDVFIYHSPCDDGFGAAWAVHQRWGDDVDYVPCSYGKPAPDVSGKNVLIGDFSFKYDVLVEMSFKARSIVILDHHKTAQEDLARLPQIYELSDQGRLAAFQACWANNMPQIATYFDMEKSGARLVWEFCHPGSEVPALIRYIEDRDLWRFQYRETRAVSLWLHSYAYDFEGWSILADSLERNLAGTVANAKAIERFNDQKLGEIIREARVETIGGAAVPVVNCSWGFASDAAHELLKANPDAPFAACYYDRGDGRRSFSLRSEDHRLDVSEIAKSMGGGGHRNAAGFEVPIP
jgi:uncharacterized protein